MSTVKSDADYICDHLALNCSLETATGDYLDIIGSYHAIWRNESTDVELRQRIQEVQKMSNVKNEIKKAGHSLVLDLITLGITALVRRIRARIAARKARK